MLASVLFKCHMVSGSCNKQPRYGAFPSLQKVLLDGTIIKSSLFTEEREERKRKNDFDFERKHCSVHLMYFTQELLFENISVFNISPKQSNTTFLA